MVKFFSSLIAGSVLAFSSLASAQLDARDGALPSSASSTSASSASWTPSSSSIASTAAPTLVSASQFIDNMIAKAEAGVLLGKKPEVSLDVAQGQVRTISNQLKKVFGSVVLRLVPVMFPDQVSPTMAKRDGHLEIPINNAALLPLVQEFDTVLKNWVVSPGYQVFLANVKNLSASIDADKAKAGFIDAVMVTVTIAIDRIDAGASTNPAFTDAFNDINKVMQEVFSHVQRSIDAGANISASVSVSASAPNSTSATSTTSTTSATSATPTLVSASQFIDNLIAKAEAGVLMGKKNGVALEVAQAQVRTISNQLKRVFGDVVSRLVPVLFPDQVAPAMAKRDGSSNVSIDNARLLPLVQEFFTVLKNWVASPGYQVFLANVKTLSPSINADVSKAGLFDALKTITNIAIDRITAAAATQPAFTDALNNIKSVMLEVFSHVQREIDAGLNDTVSSVFTSVVGTATQIITFSNSTLMTMPTPSASSSSSSALHASPTSINQSSGASSNSKGPVGFVGAAIVGALLFV